MFLNKSYELPELGDVKCVVNPTSLKQLQLVCDNIDFFLNFIGSEIFLAEFIAQSLA